MLLHLNLIRFSFKYLMITEVFIRTQWEWGSEAASFTAEELASIAFTGNALPSKDVSSPLRMVSVGLLFAGLPLRDEEEEDGGPGGQLPKHMFSLESRYHRLSKGLGATRQFPSLS